MAFEPAAMILGTGMAVPEHVLTNADLEKMVETSDQWITERSGIKERRIAEPGSGLSALAARAAKAALEDAGVAAEEVDLIILGTVTGDMKFPATACLVQEQLGASRAAAFDLSAACSGVLYAFKVAEGLIRAGAYRHILVIGGEILSSMVNWEDRETCVLFGDGAGAVLLGPAEQGRGIIATHIQSDGAFSDLLYNPGCGSLNPPTEENVREKLHTIRMRGREVFRQAVQAMTQSLKLLFTQTGLGPGELDLLIPHQANMRIIDSVGKNLGVPPERVYVNIERFGNTSAASIPIALDEVRKAGRLKEGDLLGLVAFGAGFTWGASLIRV